MRTFLLALLVALAPAVALPPASAQAPGDPGGPGCMPEGENVTCLWMFNNTDRIRAGEAMPYYVLPIQADFPRAYATVTVNFAGQDNGWLVRIVETDADGPRTTSQAGHVPDEATTSAHTATSAHLLLPKPNATQALHVATSYKEAGGRMYNASPPSVGIWRVVMRLEPLPEGVVPTRPAAVQGDPHVQDLGRDAEEEDRDLLAGWFDDARLGDGIFEARLSVMSLAHVDFNRTRDFSMPTAMIDWTMEFRVLGIAYRVAWRLDDGGASTPELTCSLDRQAPAAGAASSAWNQVMTPHCEVDFQRGIFLAVLPERSLGNPGPNDLFDQIVLQAISYPGTSTLQRLGNLLPFTDPSSPEAYPDAEDQTGSGDMRYPFALGGPAVWHVYNDRLDPPLPTILPWYKDPLGSDNLPNTLQVVGAMAAVVTFLLGALAVLSRRRQIRRHLDRIDAVERARSFDSPATLRELGVLEEEFTRLFRRGRINEAQYQILSQRIASVATRFALRRELGLDDGVPGDGAPADGPTVRVSVKDAPSERAPR